MPTFVMSNPPRSMLSGFLGEEMKDKVASEDILIPKSELAREMSSPEGEALWGKDFCQQILSETAKPAGLGFVNSAAAVADISRIAQEFRANIDYGSLRDDYMSASMAANNFGLMSPSFRDYPKIPGLKAEWHRHKQMLIDQVVIDCHWLYCRGEEVVAKWPEIQRMFDRSKSFAAEDMAELIARKNWSSGFKAGGLLSLTRRQQCALVQIRDDSIKKKMRFLMDGGSESLGVGLNGKDRKRHIPSPLVEVRRRIREWAEVRSSIKPSVLMYESLWFARELLGQDATLAQLAELAALRCGCKPLSPKTVQEKLKALDMRLAR